jgi:hypothetical protein
LGGKRFLGLPQLAASFISNQVCNVAFWHFAAFSATHYFVAYWTNSGQREAQSLNG